jgi:hypothetical protein
MRTATTKAELENEIAGRFGDAFRLHEKVPPAMLSTGVTEVDTLTGGIPRGAISEIFGPASSGRTSLMLSMLRYATTNQEVCALVDTNDVFSPTVAATAGIDLDQLLWVRCASNLEHAFKATDLLLHAGGFGLVVLDLGDVAGKDARRIISSWWYRFRRIVENKPTAILVMSEEACTRSCALLTLELGGLAEWTSTKDSLRSNVLPLRAGVEVTKRAEGETTKEVSRRNLLRFNSIKVNRCRPITPGINECKFGSFESNAL